jgi:hypothetical protein
MSRLISAVLLVGFVLGIGPPPTHGQTAPITNVTEVASLPVPDCDGVALGDIDGDGTVDLLTSSGAEGGVFWFEQKNGPTDWQRHTIYGDATEIEGNDLVDVNGDGQLEALSMDQETGEILLHRPVNDPRAEWKTTAIQSGRLFVQASLATDVDGDDRPELVYTWEGTEAGTGGVHWLDYEGGPVHEADSWTDHRMIVHESAWWLAPRRVDVNGDGLAREILYTARNLKNRNPEAEPGLFWIEPGRDSTTRWQRHAIDTTLSHPLHVDVGQFSADESNRDVVVGGFETETLSYYTGADSWQRHDLDVPTLNEKPFNDMWNVKALPLSDKKRDAMLAVLSRSSKSAMVLYYPHDDQYRRRVLKRMSYTHPMDDRLVLRDLTGDDRPEMIVPDSGGGTLSIYRFEGSD